MEKSVFLKFFAAILGFAGIAVPNVGFQYNVIIWTFGVFSSDGIFDYIDFSNVKPEKLVLMPVTTILFALGAVLMLVAALGKIKLGKIAWLPAVLMFTGVVLYFAGTVDTEIFDAAPYVFGIACGGLSGVISLVDAIISGRPAK
jgi:hypothetical protein